VAEIYLFYDIFISPKKFKSLILIESQDEHMIPLEELCQRLETNPETVSS